MANITDKTDLTQHNGAAIGENWISQIQAGNQVYDIATHHSIIFKEGSNDANGTKWNGLSDLEVVIPSITDIVQTPIEFAGTVGENGVITWVGGHTAAEAGSLVFVTVDCTFEGQACEAGDMAIYDGNKWYIVSGENQVTITGTTNEDIKEGNRTVVAIGAAKDVLEVEGKALALTLDYADLDGHVNLSTGEVVDATVANAKVKEAYVKLVKGEDGTQVIAEDVDFQRATKLADGTVTLTNSTVLKEVNFGTFTQGKMPTFTMSSEKKLDIAGGTLTPTSGQTTGDFVDSVSLNGVVEFVKADANDENKIQMLTGLVPGQGADFFNGIAETKEGETAHLTIDGYIAPADGVTAKYVKGLADNKTTVVTSITEGSFELNNKSTEVVTGFGDAAATGDVLASVTVTANNNTNVLNSASVKDHVLSFGTTNVTSGVDVEQTYKSLVKSGFTYTAPKATDTGFITSGFEKVADKNYTFSTGKETTYTTTDAMWKINNTSALDVTKGSYTINHSNMKATIPASSFVASYTDGEVPTWTNMGQTPVTITGTVGTDLSFETETIHAVKEGVTSVAVTGEYTLAGAGENGVLVGAAGALDSIEVTVDLSNYVTDVEIK